MIISLTVKISAIRTANHKVEIFTADISDQAEGNGGGNKTVKHTKKKILQNLFCFDNANTTKLAC